jgi:glycosyltransferase involved in cell wall biosynthesis
MIKPDECLFIGVEGSPQTWYRATQPARALGCDWCGITPQFQIMCSEVGPDREQKAPDLENYKVVVAQYAAGDGWMQRISALKGKGVRVIYEMDDYLHGIKDVESHVHHGYFSDRKILRMIEHGMKASDGLIVTTKFLAERYRGFCPGPTTICRNGVDLDRFRYHHQPRDYVTVGWAGATGHLPGMMSWLEGGLAALLAERKDVKFTVIGGMDVAQSVRVALKDESRLNVVPWSPFEVYPASMADCDILLAPGGQTKWHRGKSDLRWLEASALGVPCVCDSRMYPDALLRAQTPADATERVADLLDDPTDARNTGSLERSRIESLGRTFPYAAEQWRAPLGL